MKKPYLHFISFLILIIFSYCSKEDYTSDRPDKPDTSTSPSAASVAGGTVSTQYTDAPSGQDIGKIMDDDASTKFTTVHNKVWISWKSNNPIIINNYALTSANDASDKDPKSWALYGSVDGSTWKTLNTQTNQSFTARQQKKLYSFINNIAYQYYKLDITANNGATSLQLAEWNLSELSTDISTIMFLASGYSNSSVTPMGKHYENLHVTTDADRAWLNDPANEPPVPLNTTFRWADFQVTLYPFGEPVPADVNQHSVSDCGADAAFASLAYVTPGVIKSSIKDNANGTFTVSMFDPQGQKVNVMVSSKFMINASGVIAQATSKKDKPAWSTVLEKAIMKYNVIYKANTTIEGIGSEHVIPLFTGDGNSFAIDPGKLTAFQLYHIVRQSMKQGKYIIGGFRQKVSVENLETVTLHAYTITLSADNNSVFNMRNPWGFNPPGSSDDGVLKIANNESLTSLIDLRIIDAPLGTTIVNPYIPPALALASREIRVDKQLMLSGR